MSWDFHVGQKVVCVRDIKHRQCEASICEGMIYVIREIYIDPGAQEVGLRLSGMTLPIHPRIRIELGWRARHFRPLVQRKTDISIFEAMLNPSKQRVDA